ncbi:hypothetical protein AQJ11_35655 [Streptomyces corchorusii]|uniref:Uncharacterized protein n=1 Tax=Streptomyces corchorusii TaxID=1903 RepID=A0A101PUR5_STRCK|nr:hypothetical protein AQJ11_35655 [Streptomyces corchorusii]
MTTDEERAAGPFRQLAPWVFFVPDLVCGRILQGFATGTVVGAVGSGLLVSTAPWARHWSIVSSPARARCRVDWPCSR